MRFDVFCRVVDNYGDAAVCWRLARQLAVEQGEHVRLWIDNPGVLARLIPGIAGDLPDQRVDGVEIINWLPDQTPFSPGDVVIEGFGCGIPDPFAMAMAERSPKSLWVVLEYLSAEEWVDGCHGLPSPHPRLALDRYYFFPGFSPSTGGLLREENLAGSRDLFRSDPFLSDELWRSMGFSPPDQGTRTVSLFGYGGPATADLLSAWSRHDSRVVVAAAPGPLREQLTEWFQKSRAETGECLRRGSLELRLIPFLSQSRYDRLLWTCDWNFVRGEDSFVRAQWAAAPFVWQIYPQRDGIHLGKLDAFLKRYLQGLESAAANPLRKLSSAWNGRGRISPESWRDVETFLPVLRQHARSWEQTLAARDDLAKSLAIFCRERLKSRV